MKRSEINRALRGMEAMLEQRRFTLPPFRHYIRLSKKPVIARQSADWSRQSASKIHNSCIFADFQQKVWVYRHADVMREGRPSGVLLSLHHALSQRVCQTHHYRHGQGGEGGLHRHHR